MAAWNKKLILEFLELYLEEAILYDPKHPYYKNKKLIDNAWWRIQQRLSVNIPFSELKKKRDSLMASFRYQMRKKREAALLGEDFRTTWFAFDVMHGILGQLYENEIVVKTEDPGPVLEFIGFDALDDNSLINDSSSMSQEHEPELIVQDEKFESNLSEKKPKTASKRKQPPSSEQLETQSLLDQVSTYSQNSDEDECDLYGKLIAKKLRKLPEIERERLMYEIQGLFTQYR